MENDAGGMVDSGKEALAVDQKIGGRMMDGASPRDAELASLARQKKSRSGHESLKCERRWIPTTTSADK